MAKKVARKVEWSVYVLLLENRELFAGIAKNVKRRLKEQFSGGAKTSKELLKNKPIQIIRRYKYCIKNNAIKKIDSINSLTSREKETFILESLLKRPKPIILTKINDITFRIECPECKFITEVICDKSTIELECLKYKCLHETIKDKIDELFEQAILGAGCFHNGKFIFQDKSSNSARDYLLGFSGRHHRKRTMIGYYTLDEISFKNTYLLLGAILEEIYNLLQKYAKKIHTPSAAAKALMHEEYNKFTFSSINNIRFAKLAYGTKLVANILKHTGGIIEDERSGKEFIKLINYPEYLNKERDVLCLRNLIKLSNISINELFVVISRLYICIIDLVAEVFEFKKFRLTRIQHNEIIEKIVNYDTRDEFIQFLKSIKDGSVIFEDRS